MSPRKDHLSTDLAFLAIPGEHGQDGEMALGYWQQVIEKGIRVPLDRPLDELTAELTAMLGDPDPRVREEIALSTLGIWIAEGVYDELLAGLGDGMCTGLGVGLGETGTDTVFRRSYSALVLAECIDRDTRLALVSEDTLLGWGDRLTSWFVREQDLRGYVPGKGWAHAASHGSDAIAALARSPRFGSSELTVLLDVIADRLLLPSDEFFVAGEPDQMARAVIHVLRRDLLELKLLEPWIARLAQQAIPNSAVGVHPYRVAGNVQAFLRSLQLQLTLGKPQPTVRSDLMLVLVSQLIRTNGGYLSGPRKH